MTIDLLSAKVDALTQKVDLVLAKLEEMNTSGRPGITQARFAKMLGVSARTISRRVKAKKIRLEKGRVPFSEQKKFLTV